MFISRFYCSLSALDPPIIPSAEVLVIIDLTAMEEYCAAGNDVPPPPAARPARGYRTDARLVRYFNDWLELMRLKFSAARQKSLLACRNCTLC